MGRMPNKSLQATRDGGSSSASRFTVFGPACLSSGRWPRGFIGFFLSWFGWLEFWRFDFFSESEAGIFQRGLARADSDGRASAELSDSSADFGLEIFVFTNDSWPNKSLQATAAAPASCD